MRLLWFIFLIVASGIPLSGIAAKKGDDAPPPHTPTLIFYLSNIADQRDAEAITTSVMKLKSVQVKAINVARGYALLQFDSHVVSYHQVAQAITDAGKILGKHYDPRLKFTIPEYAMGDHAAKVDSLLAGKRLNQRVKIEPIDKTKGTFWLHFRPLELDAATLGPQGFNGGHLNHPIHDAPPRGLGLTCIYASED